MAETTSNQYQNQVLEAMDQLIADRLSKAQFDRTYLCKIVEVSDTTTKDNKYRYSLEYEEGSRIFVLYDEQKYYKNSYVWVSVPQSDWDGDGKRIVREYTKDDDNSIVYRNYDNGMVKVDTKIGTGLVNTTIKLTNEQYRTKLGSITFDDILLFDEPYTTIGVKAYFQTSAELINKQGNYGLGLSLSKDDSSEDYLCRLDSSLFLGDPYNLVEVAFPFSQMFKSLDDKELSIQDLSGQTIYLYLYQDGNFVDTDKTVTVSNIEVSLGYLVDEISKEPGVKIYLDNSNGYNKSTDYDDTNRNFHLGFFFFYNDDNQILTVYKNSLPQNYLIDWYRYRVGDNNIGGGLYYGKIQEKENDNTLILNSELKTIQISNDIPPITYKVILPESNISYENIEAVVTHSEEDVIIDKYVNSITLNNTKIAPIKAEEGILIKFDNDQYNTIASIYGNDNQIFENNLKISALAPIENIDLTDEIVEWRIPKYNTMIRELLGENLEKQEDSLDKDYIAYIQPAHQNKNIAVEFKTHYTPSNSNNIIQCICQELNIEGSKQINLGTYGNNGTGYSFNAFFKDGWALQPFKEDEPKNTIDVELHLLKIKEGNDILTSSMLGTLEEQFKNLEFKWLNLTNETTNDISINNVAFQGDEFGYITFKLKWNSNAINDKFYVLQIGLKNFINDNGLKTTLTTYLQVPIIILTTEIDNNYRFQGATRVVYNMMGTSASLSTEPYTENTDLINAKSDIVDQSISINDNHKLIIPNLYSPNLSKLTYYLSDGICYFPLLIIQNSYESSILNSWNGELTINDEENYILASIIGAGKTTIVQEGGEQKAKFTGVLMGTIGTQLTDAKTGLYGFNDSNKVFELNEDGKLFIGSADKGTLEFNPTNGLSINLKGSGTTFAQEFSFNQNDGLIIKAKNFSVDEDGNVVLGDISNLGTIYAGSGVIGKWTLENINDNVAALHASSKNGSTYYNTGMAASPYSNFAFWAGYQNAEDKKTPWADTTPGDKTPFYVTQNGTLHATGAIITGNITATSGTIGGCNITNGVLQVKNANIDTLSVDKITGGTNNKNITFSGAITATNANITGTIKCKSLQVQENCNITGTFAKDQVLSFNGVGGMTGATQLWFESALISLGTGSSSLLSIDTGKISLNNNNMVGQFKDNAGTDYIYSAYYNTSSKKNVTVRFYGSQLSYYTESSESRHNSWWNIIGANNNEAISDLNLKYDFQSLSDKYDNFFDALRPSQYKYIYGTSNRFHTGFIAQEIITALYENNLTTQDFAGVYLDDTEEYGTIWKLRKDEFIALNTDQIQKLKARVSQLEAQLREKGVIDNNETN